MRTALRYAFNLPVFNVSRVWVSIAHELTGPYWEMTFLLPHDKRLHSPALNIFDKVEDRHLRPDDSQA